MYQYLGTGLLCHLFLLTILQIRTALPKVSNMGARTYLSRLFSNVVVLRRPIVADYGDKLLIHSKLYLVFHIKLACPVVC